MDKSPGRPRLAGLHRWERWGKNHMRCRVCHLVVSTDAVADPKPRCRPGGGNAGLRL